ncbi:MAG: carboxypeptidase-like regulatory domain-containing protein [Prevotella sp.]|jgi:hypothetical protein|nr:carboxypeptidase-like regulatory domain-containing protein [Prevotella sp.]
MKHKYYYSILLLAACLMVSLSATAQHKTVVYGNLGVSNVNINITNTRYGTSTDYKGRYTLTLHDCTKAVNLYYSCIGYQDTIVSFTPKQLQHDSINISFKMRPKSYALNEVTVSGNKPEIAYHEKMVSLVTYEINEMGIYLIGYRQSGNALLHLSFDLDTLSVLPIAKKYDRLYKDVFGQIHLMSYDSTYQIGHRQLGDTFLDMELFYGMSIAEFYYIMGNNAAVTDSVFVIATYGEEGQELYYHYFKRGNPNGRLLEHVFDQEMLDFLENGRKFGEINGFGRRVSSSTPDYYAHFVMRPRLDIRKWTLAPKPIYDPLYAIGDSLVLFNFEADKNEYFDENAQMIGETPIKFHRYQNWNGKWLMKDSWKKMVLVDKVKKVSYAVFEDESVMSINKIDFKTGQTTVVARLTDFHFVQLPMVNNGMLYFLYHTGPTHSKALYQMRLD